eukprot:CAMPEP_0201574368 /NCGR_PEP_ID=MMETSP0190_2-20130828/18806_1 /ASSEMBLY_ACC=CAM_ASM_000263 /TAXON_ID=37353 /ORGANISM="Rosalina sp." /LENGTH=661 /DNA_ID=CAMNT_0048002515 /DNA_START=126 /DNA_END=2111 /DNA_ORIENTATION=-
MATSTATSKGEQENKSLKNENEANDNDEEKKEEEEIPDMGGSKRLGKEYGSKYCCYTLGGYLFASLNGCMMPLFGVLFREILDILAESIDPVTGESNFAEKSLRTLVYWLAMGTGCGTFTILQYYFWGTYGTRVSIDVRSEWFESVIQQDIKYHDRETSSKLNALLTTETAAIEAGVGIKMGFLVQQLASFVFGIILAFFYSWRLTLALMATIPVLVCIGIIQGLLFAGAGKDSDPFVGAGTFSQEVLTNIRTVLSIPDLVTSKYKGFVQKVLEGFPISTKRAGIAGFGLGFFMLGMIGIMYAVGLYAGARFVEAGYIGVGDMFGAFFCFMISGMGLGQLGSVVPDLQKANIGANKFYYTKSRVPDIKSPDNGLDAALKPSGKLGGSLEFKNVSFAYDSNPELQVLKNVSFKVSSGETFAIVGPSGSGKSTIISLIERFYDPASGDIIIDDTDKIHNYDIGYLRSSIGLVSQMPLLFDASIDENIRGGNTEATNEDVITAATSANAHDFITTNLPDGYQTSVGELGGRLSGGQRQRIAIARAMLAKPSILLLDEATSALDSKSEREVQEAIDNIASTRNQTVIAIAHRLSTIKNADTIIVLVDGEIREQGNHQSLMDKGGVYFALVTAQALVEQKKQVHQRQRSSQMGLGDGINIEDITNE